MADDEEELEIEDPEEPNADGDADDADADDIDGEDIDGEFEEDFAAEGEFADDDEDEDDEDDDGDDAPAKAKSGDADDEDDEPDPDDVEEDLDVILKDRLASGDDLDEDEEEDDDDKVVAPPITVAEGDKVTPKREDEWTCNGCFLIVSARQFGKRETATCPSGVGDCPSLEML